MDIDPHAKINIPRVQVMSEEQFKESITTINYLWTIGIIDFKDAQRIVERLQMQRSLEIIFQMRRNSATSRVEVQQTSEG